MSEKEFSNDGNIPHVPEEHVPEEHEEDEVQDAEEVQEAERCPVETASRDSGHDSLLEHSVTCSQYSGHDPTLEGAVANVLDDALREAREFDARPIKSGKKALFRKFFDKEYDQPRGVPVLSRQRHSAERQITERVRRRHVSEDSVTTDSTLSDPNPLGCLQYAGTSSGAILNQAGAIIGKKVQTEEIPDFKTFGTEYGQSLPPIPLEGSEHSISSVETACIGDLYYAAYPVRPSSDDSRGLSPGSSFPSFSSRPPTDASDYVVTYPPPGFHSPVCPESSEGDRPLSPTTNEDSGSSAQGKRVRQRRFGVVTRPVQIRSKSAHAGYSCYEGESSYSDLRKISKDMSVCSEPLPQRKISTGSSVDYEQRSLEDEDVDHPELSHSLERDSCLPMPDLDPADLESLQENLDALTVAPDIVTDAVEPNVAREETEETKSEQNPDTVACERHCSLRENFDALIVAPDIVIDAVEPNAVRQETEGTESEHDPDVVP